MNNRLILLEGLPGTGKSTNSFKLLGQQIIPQWTETGTIYTKQVSERSFYDPIQ